jgi:hypothetical protein
MTNLDRFIDDVARGMVAGAPSGDFTARTMARISGQRRARTWWRLLPAGAAVASVAVAVAVALSGGRVGGLPVVPDPRPAPLSTGTLTRAPVIEPAAAAPRLPVRHAVMSAAERVWQDRRLPALPGPAPITSEGIQPEPLAVPLLNLKPLITEPLIIEPIDGVK